ncbi:poly-beta-1,6-N-acetyl-D-glucosamine biosynthesis protein PgaD [Enterobacter chuandaensis]|uniref:poly-beta-1,6-N-acetyl-D-glucosamine biosynthesis protein PgaD n=1 Tax=Enterobacter chuandaensis TaxID=2497875 RepID=UPI002FD2EFF1
MKQWIINSQKNLFRECLELFVTCLLWAVFVYFASGFIAFFLKGFAQGNDAFLRLFLYFILAILNALALVLWAIYNRYKHQRIAIPPSHVASEAELAMSFSLPQPVYQQFQANKKLYVDFNSHGDVVNVTSEQ